MEPDNSWITAASSLQYKQSIWYKIKSNKIAYLFIAPWLISFLMFTLYPMLSSFYISMTDFNPLDSKSINNFVGMKNYAAIFTDANFHTSLINTLVFTVITIPITTCIALLLAVALNEGVKFKTLFRVGFFLPTVTSVVVISTLFKLLLFKDGLFTKIVEALGFEGRNWLLDAKTALPSIMIMCIWSAVGFYMVIYLSALQAIPADQYESATIDGAGSFKRFIYITLPHLRQATLYVVVMNVINSMQIFTEPQVMTRGGPVYATTTGVLYLYREGFSSQRMGYASAVGYVLFAIILVISLINMLNFGFNKGVDD